MPINVTNVTFGNAQRGWTAGSISPRAPVSGPMLGPVANIPMSGNIPTNVLQAVGNLQGEQAFRNFLSNLIVPQGGMFTQSAMPPPDPAALVRAETERTRQQAALDAARAAQWELSGVNQALTQVPTGFGGIGIMGDPTRYNLQSQQLRLRPQVNALNAAAFGAPRYSGWTGGF